MLKLLLFTVIGFSFFVFFSIALAQESAPSSPSPSPVEYALPYPGILPDHPLFFIKVIRDRILVLLISNPQRRIEFYQLLSDKYIQMGIFLLDQEKYDKAATTIKQAEKYIGETKKAIDSFAGTNASQAGNSRDRFNKAVLKYTEIFQAKAASIPQPQRDYFSGLVERLIGLTDSQ